MKDLFLSRQKNDEVTALSERKNIQGLIHLLKSRDPHIQSEAQNALVALGDESYPDLIAALKKKDRTLRMGVMGALSGIKDPRAIPYLTSALLDQSSEVRWQAAIALGEIGDVRAISSLVSALQDEDKYVRYSSAVSLKNLGWEPTGDQESAQYHIGLQEWDQVTGMGKAALPPLTKNVKDKDRDVRISVIRTLGDIGDPDADSALIQAVGDTDREVRWEAVLASERCGIPPSCLPRALNSRPRTTKNPLIAGFLNFILPGLGYGYIGRWWGIMIFQIDITVTVWLFKVQGEANSYQILFPVYILLALHAWYIARNIPDDPP